MSRCKIELHRIEQKLEKLQGEQQRSFAVIKRLALLEKELAAEHEIIFRQIKEDAAKTFQKNGPDQELILKMKQAGLKAEMDYLQNILEELTNG